MTKVPSSRLFQHSTLLSDLILETQRFCRIAGAVVGGGAIAVLGSAVYSEAIRAPALATAGVLGLVDLALLMYLFWKRVVCATALKQMRTLELRQPPKLSGPDLELYRDAWALARGHFGDLPELPFT